MGLFGEYICENLPFIGITMEEIERIARHHFPDNEIYREGNKLFIKSDKLMDSRRFDFRANAELTIEKSNLCFKTKINKKTLLFYLFALILLIGLWGYRAYRSYSLYQNSGIGMLFGNQQLSFWSSEGLELLVISVVYILVFAISLAYQLNKVSKFLVRTMMAAIKTYKMNQ